MDLRQLRYFLAVAEAGQFTAAAAQLGIQQPPLSQQIQALERTLGLALLRRHPKGVTLTEAGLALQRDGRRLMADAQALAEHMRSLARGNQGLLHVAFTSSAAAHGFTPQALRECRRRHPGIEWVVTERNAAEITEEVLAGRLHCGFLRVPVAEHPELDVRTLLREPAIAALPIDHRLARRRSLQPMDFDGEALILVRRPGAPGLYANLLAWCQAHGAQPRVVAEVDRMMTNLNLVAAGVGMSIVPDSMRGAHPDSIAYRALATREASLDAPLSMMVRHDRCQGALRCFVDVIEALAAAQASTPPAGAKATARASVRRRG